ncbi:MAG: phosphoenolpyruvate--protein phosphotransferase [bacterium]|nr:phosphoenolpyruvate--protein phosphotransferase [bacterium]
MRNKLLRGIPASPGIVIAKAIPYKEEELLILTRKPDEISEEITKFENALQKTRREIQLIQSDFMKKTDEYHARILDAQLLVLDDTTLIKNTIDIIKRNESAESAFKKVADSILNAFDRVEDEYLRARISDIRDVAGRVLRNLIVQPHTLFPATKHAVVAQDLTPSDTAGFSKDRVVGFATDLGGTTSHTAIMARALEIPAVVGLNEVTKFVDRGDEIIIDGNRGVVVIDPDESTRRAYEDKLKKFQEYEKELEALSNLPCETLDGQSIELSCNIEITEEIDAAISHGAKGIGLMRTEFIYLKSDKLPTEEEQYEVYNLLAQKVHPDSLIIRTLDLGGDKIPSPHQIKEVNPSLGWRAIRFSLSEKSVFMTQLKAILRASRRGNVKIMFPMIVDLSELKLAKSYVEEAKSELKNSGIDYDPDIEIGAMIETPGAALIARAIAEEVDFLSIGSNDLIQYTLACDRTNPRVAHLFNPFHPAILRLIKRTIEAGHSARKWVGICGELGANPLAVPILLGLGIDELSVATVSILEIKKIIRALSIEEAKTIAREVMALETLEEVESFVKGIEEKVLVIKEVMSLSR